MTYEPYSEREIRNGHIIFKKIVHDECSSNPLEDWDAMGSIFSFNSRHCNHIDREQVEAYIDEYGEDAVFLSYFEHGNCLWGVAGTMSGMPDFRWDGVGTAGLWIPDKYLLEEAEKMEKGSPERLAKMKKWAGQACEVYTQWCNGEVYGATVEVYKVRESVSGDIYDRREDYRYETSVFEESCFGFFGMECAEENLENEFLPMAREAVAEALEA
jgi:hypothetical protein